MDRRRASASYQLFMLAMSLFAIAILVLEVVVRHDAEMRTVLEHADTFLCMIFLIDFGITFSRAPRRLHYLMTWGWIDLLSAVPALDAARWGRIVRVARLARVLRALRASRALSKTLVRERSRSAILAAAVVAIFMIVGSSAAILYFEDPAKSNIQGAGDALWWAFTTITTVGYGDRFPISTEGRVIAMLLMTAGVGIFGALSAALAAWFIAPDEEQANEELEKLRAEIASLRALLEERLPNHPVILSREDDEGSPADARCGDPSLRSG